MATMPPQDDEQAELAAGAPDDESAEGETEEGGFTVCIHSDAEGALSVGVEGGDMQPVNSVKEAMTVALGILKSGGTMEDPNANQQEFAAGFKGDSL